MKKIKLNLEFKAFPIWLYDENGTLLDNDSPEILLKNKELDDNLVQLQNNYDKLFINNDVEFKYLGFQDSNEKKLFEKNIQDISNKIKETVQGKYQFENVIDLENF